MEEHGKRRLAAAGAVVAGIAYFLICAIPLPRELVLVPVWARDLSGAGIPAAAGAKPAAEATTMPFTLGQRFGYFDSQGRILFAAPRPYGVAVSRQSFTTYERLSTSFSLRSPGGPELLRCDLPGYPFMAAGRLFVVGPNQSTVSEIGGDGKPKWTYEFPSIVTAFGASPGLAAFGLLDGTMIGLDASGAEALHFSPGGSRIAGIYGLAVAPDGLMVAAIAGLDKQRLLVLERRSSAFRVTYHRWLDSDFRRPVALSFTSDGRKLVYEAPGGAGVYDRATRSESLVAVPGPEGLGLSVGAEGLLVLIGQGTDHKRLVLAAAPDRRIADLPVFAKETFLECETSSLFLGMDDKIVRLDLREE
ncbi:MAG TPA: hypothetical protein VFL04_04300 [Rectinemataceae bacterium]|nr:hypothetical protein [Rectinemataceae bacterium]